MSRVDKVLLVSLLALVLVSIYSLVIQVGLILLHYVLLDQAIPYYSFSWMDGLWIGLYASLSTLFVFSDVIFKTKEIGKHGNVT